MPKGVISADCHIDLIWLPPDLFTDNATAAMKDRMPYVTDGPIGPVWVSNGGGQFGLQNGMGSAGREYVPGVIPIANSFRHTPGQFHPVRFEDGACLSLRPTRKATNWKTS